MKLFKERTERAKEKLIDPDESDEDTPPASEFDQKWPTKSMMSVYDLVTLSNTCPFLFYPFEHGLNCFIIKCYKSFSQAIYGPSTTEIIHTQSLPTLSRFVIVSIMAFSVTLRAVCVCVCVFVRVCVWV